MSTDVLRRNISRQLEYLSSLQSRGLPPITCILSRLEGEPPDRGYSPRFSPLPAHEGWPSETVMTDAAFHPSLGVREPHVYSSHWGAHGGNHVTIYTGVPRPFDMLEELTRPLQSPPLSTDQRDPVSEAIRIARDIGERLVPLIRALPARLAERLGFVRATLPNDWAEILFHLGWHFPDHGIEASRFRILSATEEAPWDFRCFETELQLGGVRYSADVFPGVIVSRLGDGSDFLTASISALQLILEAVEGIERAAQPRPSAEFGHLRDTFLRLAEAYSHHPRDLTAQVLGLADSFRTPPATEWAGIERGGDGWGIPKYYVLSHLDANRVVCALHGPALETFQELANRAGALLPTWPAQRYPALLHDVGAFARYCDPAQFPWATAAGDMWNYGMVTDHRGNVERWLGLVYGLLMAHRLEHLNLLTRPENVTRSACGEPINAMLTLRGMTLFTASARAIEFAGLVPQQQPETVRQADETTVPISGSPTFSPGDTSSPVCGSPIDEAELSVLIVLRDRHPVLLKNVDIEEAANLSKQKAGEVVAELISKSLVIRPKGDRKGATVTQEGISLVDRIRKSSADHP